MAAALLVGADADARLADGSSFGGGQSGVFISSPIAASAAPTPSAGETLLTAQVGPSPYYPHGSLRRLFHRGGLLGGFAAGFLGTGLLGVLLGRGLFAGLDGVASYFGSLFQLALWLALARLIWSRWRGDSTAGGAILSPRQLAAPYLRSRDDLHAGPILPPGPEADDTTSRPGTDYPEIGDARSERK